MLALLSAIFGFLAPFVPEIIKVLQRSQDNKHELEMLRLRMQQQANDHTYRMEEINLRADIDESLLLHKPQASFGVQLLDAVKAMGSRPWVPWIIVPGFWLYAFLDAVSALVRPSVTYAIFGLYAGVKFAQFKLFTEHGASPASAVLSIWAENDWAILTLVLSYWFGGRIAKAVFGGSTNTAYKNG